MHGNRLIDDNKLLFEAIGKIRAESDQRRLIEDELLAKNGFATKKQLFGDNLKRFEQIIEDIVQGKLDKDDVTIEEGLFGFLKKKTPREKELAQAQREKAAYEKNRAKEYRGMTKLNRRDPVHAGHVK